MELPVKFKEQMKELLQEEYEDYLNSLIMIDIMV